MHPSVQPTATQVAAPEALRAWEDRPVFDTVRVAPETFRQVMYMSAEPRREFVRGERIPDNQKPQKKNREGVPVWAVKIAAVNWRGQSDMLTVTIAASENPGSADRISPAGAESAAA